MPTEFTRTIETLNELNNIVNSYKSIDDNIYLSKYYHHILELQTNINNSISKFQNRITTGIYNSNMTTKVNDIILRFNILSNAINVIKNDYNEYKRKIEQEEQEEMAKKKMKFDDTIDANNNTTIAIDNTTTVDVSTNIDNTTTVDSTIASVTTTVDTTNTTTNNNNNDNNSATNSKAADITEVPIEAEATSSRLGSKMLSETYATSLVQAIAKSLGINLEQGLSRKHVKDIISTILVSKMNNSSYEHAEGWKRWHDIEAEAAFILMDTDNSGTISESELIHFASNHPQVFGPLSHIERLFRSFDTNGDGVIDGSELFNLLLECELEITTSEPDLEEINSKTLQYMAYYDRNKDQGLDLIEFVRLVYAHSELLGTAINMRSYFVEADSNKDDKLDKNEVSEMLTKFISRSGLPFPNDFEQMIENIMKDADSDTDGFISFTEFMDYFVRNPNSVSIFNLILNFAKELNPLEDSCFLDLCKLKENALNLTDPKNPLVVLCSTCSAPLVGLKVGIEKFERPFCNNNCVADFDGLSQERSKYLSMYYKADFRAVSMDDHINAGNANRRFFNNKRGDGFFRF